MSALRGHGDGASDLAVRSPVSPAVMTSPVAERPGRAVSRSGTAIAALPGIAAVAVFLSWAALDGGQAPVIWYPGALVLLGLLALVLWTRSRIRAGLRWFQGLALTSLGLFAGWSLATVAWADVRGDAWDGGNRAVLYLVVFALFSLWPWTAGGARLVLTLFSFGVFAVLAAACLRAALATDPSGFFVDGRLAEPTGYVNANVALAMMAFWPAIVLASRRELAWPLRTAMLAVAGGVFEIGLLSQSRGALVAIPLAALLCLVVVPDRLRLLLTALPVAMAVGLVRGALLDVYPAAGTPAFVPAVGDAVVAIGLSLVALVAVGGVLAFLDARRRSTSDEPSRRIGRAAAIAGVAGVAVILAVLPLAPGPSDRLASAWQEFKGGETTQFGGSHLVGGLGSNRYDFWRVAWGDFQRHPLTGIGADNFATSYVRDRADTGEEPLYPHSLELMVLSQTGAVGAALLSVFLGAVAAAMLALRRHPDRLARALGAAAILTASYWVIHGSLDWFWEFPGLGGPAFALLGLAVGLAARSPRPDRVSARASRLPRPRMLFGTLTGALILGAAVTFAVPWLAARDVDAARKAWRADPGKAFALLGQARALNPLSAAADLTAGAIAGRVGDLERMRVSYLRALERNPLDWYAQLQVAVIDGNAGDRAGALERLALAERLNPREPTITEAIKAFRAGSTVSLDAIRAAILERVEVRVT